MENSLNNTTCLTGDPLRIKAPVPNKIRLRWQRNQQMIKSLQQQIIERSKSNPRYVKVQPIVLKRLNKRSESQIVECHLGWRDVNKWLRRLSETTVEWVSNRSNSYFTERGNQAQVRREEEELERALERLDSIFFSWAFKLAVKKNLLPLVEMLLPEENVDAEALYSLNKLSNFKRPVKTTIIPLESEPGVRLQDPRKPKRPSPLWSEWGQEVEKIDGGENDSSVREIESGGVSEEKSQGEVSEIEDENVGELLVCEEYDEL